MNHSLPQYSAQQQPQQYNQEYQMFASGSNYMVNQSPPVAQYQQQIYLRPQGHLPCFLRHVELGQDYPSLQILTEIVYNKWL
jgi:hypothetical protein